MGSAPEQWHVLVRFPQEDCAGWVAAIKGVEQIAHARFFPDVAALHFRQAKFAALNHADKFINGGFRFCHKINRVWLR